MALELAAARLRHAAAFGMYSRYVDGLAASVPDDAGDYERGAVRILEHGYTPPVADR
jgi:hypothetical protein